MHEFSIAQNMVELAASELEKAQGNKVTSMNLKIGKMSGVVPEALAFAFPAAAKGTKLEACKLNIMEIPMEVECMSCNQLNELDEFVLICPSCSSTLLKIKKGKEIQIESMEIE